MKTIQQQRVTEDEMKRFREFWGMHPEVCLGGDLSESLHACLLLINSRHRRRDASSRREFEGKFNLVKAVSQQNGVWPQGYDSFYKDALKGKLNWEELRDNCSRFAGYKMVNTYISK